MGVLSECMSMHYTCSHCHPRPEEHSRSPGTGVRASCELVDWIRVTGSIYKSSQRSSSPRCPQPTGLLPVQSCSQPLRKRWGLSIGLCPSQTQPLLLTPPEPKRSAFPPLLPS